MRVVSLACSNTEIVAALGRADLLVGVDDHSDFPSDVVGRLPRVGPDLNVDVEAVAALGPDLVLATLTVPGHERVVERLDDAGLPFVAPEPTCLEDVYRDIVDIGSRLDASAEAKRLVGAMRAELDAPPPGPEAPSILVQWWPKPVIAPGRRSWSTDVLHAAGARGLLDHEAVKSRPLSDEEVAELAPDAVVLSWCGVDPAKYRPEVVYRTHGWRDVPAVRNRQVHCVPEAYLGRPGPRLVDGVRMLREIVRKLGG